MLTRKSHKNKSLVWGFFDDLM